MLHRWVEAAATARGAGTNTEDMPYNYDTKYNSFSLGGEKKMNLKDNNLAIDSTMVGGGAKPRYIASLLRMAEHQDCKHKFLHKQRVIGKQAAGKDPVYKEGAGTIGKGGGGTDET